MFKIFLRKIKEMDFKKLDRLATRIAKRNNKSVFYVKIDMFLNFIKYKIGYTDYMKGDYINLTKEEKKNFLTSKNYINLIDYLNKKSHLCTMQDKILFNKIFNKYIKRDYIDIRVINKKEFKKFLENKKIVFGKKQMDFGSHGIRKIILKDIKDYDKLYDELISNKQYLVEDGIVQHKELDKFNPYAVNTLRIITLLDKSNNVHVLANALRINTNDDNAISCFDAFMQIDCDGNVISDCVDDNEIIYDRHPDLNYKFKDLKVPFAKECFEMVKEAALLVPEIRYIGWDVAIGKEGPELLEGNEFPSYGLIQYYLLTGKTGHLKTIKDALNGEIDNLKL